MATESVRILAVNPGSRYVGIAVFLDAELREWRVRSLAGSDPRGKERSLCEMISAISETYDINTFVIKELHPSRSSPQLRSLAGKAKEAAKKRGLRICEFSIASVKESVVPNGRSNKRRIMGEMAARYPFLYRELEREMRNKTTYLVRMFEAVALGMTFLEKS